MSIDRQRIFYDVDQSDTHGSMVFSFVGGYDSIPYGYAYESELFFARSEDVSQEVRQEEDNWVAALEWMDSVGVRMITSSLGYNKFDDGFIYDITAMDGKTAVISKVIKTAVKDKGIFVVIAAGNGRIRRRMEYIDVTLRFTLCIGCRSM